MYSYTKNLNHTLENPVQKVYGLCANDYFRNTTCRKKAQTCRNSVMIMDSFRISYISKFDSWSKSIMADLEKMSGENLKCSMGVMYHLTFQPNYKSFSCVYLRYGSLGSDLKKDVHEAYCKMGIHCRTMAYTMIKDYEKNHNICKENAHPYEYGLRVIKDRDGYYVNYEYLRTRISGYFPKHVNRKCADEFGTIVLEVTENDDGSSSFSNEHGSSILLECKRQVHEVVALMEKIPNCLDFVSRCKTMLACVVASSTCSDGWFGNETNWGYPTDLDILAHNYRFCHHWAAELHSRDGKIFCRASGVYRFEEQSSFCSSFARVCTELVRCAKDEKLCKFGFNDEKMTTGQFKNLLFDFPAPIPWDKSRDPRINLPAIYECNKEFGFAHKIHLYFYRMACRAKNCSYERSGSTEKLLQAASHHFNQRQALYTDRFDRPGALLWYCKRDVFSSSSCQHFNNICSNISDCIKERVVGGERWKVGNAENDINEQCLSSMPLHTEMPLPELAKYYEFLEWGEKVDTTEFEFNTNNRYTSGKAFGGNALTHLIPLGDKSYEPSLVAISATEGLVGFAKKTKEYFSKFFQDRFLGRFHCPYETSANQHDRNVKY